MMISVVIAPTIVGDAASEPTRARPFIAVAPYMWGRSSSLAEEEVEEVLGGGAAGRAPVQTRHLRDLGQLGKLRDLVQRDAGQQVVELLLGVVRDLVRVDALEDLVDLLLLLRRDGFLPRCRGWGRRRRLEAGGVVGRIGGVADGELVAALRADARVVAAQVPEQA